MSMKGLFSPRWGELERGSAGARPKFELHPPNFAKIDAAAIPLYTRRDVIIAK